MYVIRVPWDPSLPSRFRQVRSNVEYVDRLVQEWRLTRPPALGGDNTTVGSIDGTEECVVVRQPDLTTSVFEGDDASDIWKWRRLRERLCRAVDDAHPCIRTVFEAGALRDVSVNLDHLEKDQIRWWSTVSLAEVLRCRGSLDAERFRPYFLPVLQTFLQLVGGHRRRCDAIAALMSRRASRTARSDGAQTSTWRSSGCGTVHATNSSGAARRSRALRSTEAIVCCSSTR